MSGERHVAGLLTHVTREGAARAACSCGWRGQLWAGAADARRERQHHLEDAHEQA